MRSLRSLTLCLTLSLCALGVSACADKAPTFQRFPPAVDLRGTAKPQAPVDIVTSAKAAADARKRFIRAAGGNKRLFDLAWALSALDYQARF